jgi:hypothetical protein
MTFNPDELRGPDGRWIHFPEIHMSDLSTPDARRSPEVSPEEFQKHARRGALKFNKLRGSGYAAKGLQNGPAWNKVVDDAFTASREPWGGVTVDAHTGEHVADNADAYALTMREPGMASVHVSPKADKAEFTKAMETARERYKAILRRPGSHLGVFHDQDTGNIDIDPVLVTPSLKDVHDIGAYTHAVGGAYHFKSGDGFWPPHVKETKPVNLSFVTPAVHNKHVDLAQQDGKLAFWKQILPKRRISYTAKDGSAQQIDFTEQYLANLANSKAVDKIGFLLADRDNAHTMDPERWRGEVAELAVRDDGLYGKIVFPSAEAAKAVLSNPELGVSARIRPGGGTAPGGIVHVLGTLDPQAQGMKPWEATDLSTTDEVLDLSNEEYSEMATKKALADYTDEDIDKMTDEELDAFLAEHAPEALEYNEVDEPADEVDEPADEVDEAQKEKVGADMANKATDDIELANQRAESANKRAAEAMRRVAEAEWKAERADLLGAGVPPHALDLAMPVLCRPDDMVIDLSNEPGEKDVNVSEVVRGLLDTLKGTVDLSAEEGHGEYDLTNAEDPDREMLDLWSEQF